MSQIRPNYFKGNFRFFNCRKGFLSSVSFLKERCVMIVDVTRRVTFGNYCVMLVASPHWFKRQLAGGLFSNSTTSQIVAVMQAN